MIEETRGSRYPDRPLSGREQANLSVIASAAGEIALLFPTATGLKKSIFDATEGIRSWMKATGIHDFAAQRQGQDAKVVRPIQVLLPERIIDSELSLYRPMTKTGDPRLWISGAAKWADPGDVLALFASRSRVYVANLSRLILEAPAEGVQILGGTGSIRSALSAEALGLLDAVRSNNGAIAAELLRKLKKIAARGPIPAQGHGDTAVGRTLEHLLGIAQNSRREPDYQGIEIKTKRFRPHATRQTLFAQVPDWTISTCKSSAEILSRYGYFRNGAHRLNCTVRLEIPNSQGLFLSFKKAQRLLTECHTDEPSVAVWKVDTLEKRLLEKHRETFWVSATSVREGGVEYFSFNSVQHTRAPSVALFNDAIDKGRISVDHLIKNLNGRVSERGPLFKVVPSGIPLLFPARPEFHDLREAK